LVGHNREEEKEREVGGGELLPDPVAGTSLAILIAIQVF